MPSPSIPSGGRGPRRKRGPEGRVPVTSITEWLHHHPELIGILAGAAGIASLFLVPRMTGWSILAEVYPASGSCTGSKWRFQSAAMRWGTHYGNALTIGADQQYLWISVFFPIRFGHPALMIPWSEVSAAKVEGLLSRYVELRFLRAPAIPFRISERLARQLDPFMSRGGRSLFATGGTTPSKL